MGRRALVAIVALGFAIRLAWALYATGEPPLALASGDQFSYYYYGREIAAGRGYVNYITSEATAYYPIGYPALLGALYFVVLQTPFSSDLMMATSLFHVILGTASVALTFVIGRRLANERVGLIAAAILAFFPNLVFYVASVQLETTFIFFVLLALVAIVDHDWSAGPPTRLRLLAFGAALGSAVLVRPFAAVLLVGLAGALWSLRLGWRRVALNVAIPLAVVAALSVPWTIRNAVEMDAFIPSSTNMGDTLCLDRSLDATGGFRFADHDGCVDPALAEVPRNRGNTDMAIQFVLEHPGRELLQIGRRAGLMFQHDHDGIEAIQTLGGGAFLSPGLVEVAEPVADGYFFAVVGLTLAGAPLLALRHRGAQRLPFASGLVGLLAIPLLLWGNPRFHVPLAPFGAVMAAIAIEAGWARLRRSRPVESTAEARIG